MSQTSTGTKKILQSLQSIKDGNFSFRLPTDWEGDDRQIALCLNQILEQLSFFTTEVIRVTSSPDTYGIVGTSLEAKEFKGGEWERMATSINAMAHNITLRVRELNNVSEAALQGNFSKKIEMKANGEILELKNRLQQVFDQMNMLTDAHASAEKDHKQKIEELQKFKELTIDRELKMIELKKEIAKLKNV
ncbi:MAG: hypothetical protein EPO57_02810 [Chitinophagaceae bacterium]|nr:MAG: hypothetical protein EPO57_02810 [Chitinophagaceae bacterium]